jgi:hypothetical protein
MMSEGNAIQEMSRFCCCDTPACIYNILHWKNIRCNCGAWCHICKKNFPEPVFHQSCDGSIKARRYKPIPRKAQVKRLNR